MFMGANMGHTWVLSAPDGPHVGPMKLAIWEDYLEKDLSNISFTSPSANEFTKYRCQGTKLYASTIAHK